VDHTLNGLAHDSGVGLVAFGVLRVGSRRNFPNADWNFNDVLGIDRLDGHADRPVEPGMHHASPQ
jgi:hypothetical protein